MKNKCCNNCYWLIVIKNYVCKIKKVNRYNHNCGSWQKIKPEQTKLNIEINEKN